MDRISAPILGRLGTPTRAPRVLAGVPLLFFSLPIVATVLTLGPSGLLMGPVLWGMAMHALWVSGLLYGAYRIYRHPLSAERYSRLLAWVFGIGLVFFAINLVATLSAGMFNPVETLGWMAFSANTGMGIGLLVGLTEARAIDRAVAAERSATESALLAEQRDRFAYMNAILRHEVMNNVQVIRGQAEYLLGEDLDEETAAHLEIISRQSQDMADVVSEIRVISQGLEESDLESIDLRRVLYTELVDVRDTYEDVDVELDCPPGIRVTADELLARVFSNLFANAVEHNEADIAHLSVTVDVEDDAVAVHVADDGPGVPDAVQESMFDQSRGPHGIGLYLVDTLVSNYGGAVELAETGPDGSVFTVELERATDAPETAESASGTAPLDTAEFTRDVADSEDDVAPPAVGGSTTSDD